MYPSDATKSQKVELNKHKYIEIKLIDNVMLYFSRVLGVFCSKCCFPKKEKFQKLYDIGEDKLSTELDIVKILKTLRDMKILLKGTLMNDPETKFQVKHAPKNIINLDESSDLDGNNQDSQETD